MARVYERDLYPDCPAQDWSCPYLGDNGRCMMYKEEGCPPYDECDEFYGLEEEKEEEE